ncbi:CAP-Gly domain [Carpediemonas membranifera]|uniref:CAP-Gly domain n=1 Tax=Carpediemonas membranifera TaxID=201153 RepID=A0A8J6B286_9EUKA|nr:CAP-Gly domain [Carpediemonas membranifera]|eukprot:KAG9394173.1 CAP-Gly domain [Carpediemonas membranifera]
MQVGKRFIFGTDIGTIRYIGPIKSAKAADVDYVGVEWDEDSKRKTTYDGSFDGDRYFTCDPKRGSFFKRSAVEGKFAFATPFFAEIQDRYEKNTLTDADREGMFLNTGNRTIQIEFVGEEKISARQSMTEHITDFCLKESALGRPYPADIAEADISAHISAVQAKTASLVSLDISRCLLTSWADLGSILAMCPAVETVRVDGNHMGPVAEGDPALIAQAAPKLRELFASNCGLRGEDIARLAAVPGLRALHVAENSLGTVTAPPSSLSLVRLGLERCGVDSWATVQDMTKGLTILDSLALEGNPLGDHQFTGESFPQSLRHITVSGTAINSWTTLESMGQTSVDSLRTGAEQVETDVRPVAVLEGLTAHKARLLCIARLGWLRLLNGAPVNQLERQDAERSYVRSVVQSMPGSTLAEIEAAHPMVPVLIDRHEMRPEFPALFGKAAKTTVLVHFKVMSGDDEIFAEDRDVPLSITVSELLKLVPIPAGHAAVRDRAAWVDPASGRTEELTKELLLVRDIGLDDGYEVRIPVTAVKRRRR